MGEEVWVLLGRLISIVEGWVSVLWDVVLCSCMMCAACVMSHIHILRSGVCPSIWHLSFSDKPRADVALGCNPMRSFFLWGRLFLVECL